MSLLAEILSSRVRAEFFRLFFGMESQRLHLREIERRSGFSIGAVRQEASKLVRNGLLHKQTVSNRTYYSANTNSTIYPEIHSLVLKTIGLSDLLTNILDISAVQYAFVFGSVANGTARYGSDVDLFVIGELGLRKMSKLLMGATDKIGREINVHTMTLEEFLERRNSKEHFISSIVASPKLMLIGKEDELTELA